MYLNKLRILVNLEIHLFKEQVIPSNHLFKAFSDYLEIIRGVASGGTTVLCTISVHLKSDIRGVASGGTTVLCSISVHLKSDIRGGSEPIFSGLYAYHIPTNTWKLVMDDSTELRSRIGWT
jgi:hypothetical protein